MRVPFMDGHDIRQPAANVLDRCDMFNNAYALLFLLNLHPSFHLRQDMLSVHNHFAIFLRAPNYTINPGFEEEGDTVPLLARQAADSMVSRSEPPARDIGHEIAYVRNEAA
ncbi:MAG: hypothetical protein Q9210_006431 [Variospora velana]